MILNTNKLFGVTIITISLFLIGCKKQPVNLALSDAPKAQSEKHSKLAKDFTGTTKGSKSNVQLVNDKNRYVASSTLAPSTASNYEPRNVFDGDPDTAWCEGIQGNGEGEWIALYLGEIEDIGQFTEFGISVKTGYQKSYETLTRNGRPDTTRIELFADDVLLSTLYSSVDEYHYVEKVTVSPPTSGSVWLKLTIIDVRPGEKWQDTCISEIKPHLHGANPHNAYSNAQRFCNALLEKDRSSLRKYTDIELYKLREMFTNEFVPEEGPQCSPDTISVLSSAVFEMFQNEWGDGGSVSRFEYVGGRWTRITDYSWTSW